MDEIGMPHTRNKLKDEMGSHGRDSEEGSISA
jgi:hypothetical protein